MPAPDPTAHRHDGFYMRIGLGGGYFGAKVEPEVGTLHANGGGPAFEFALGGTVADGVVIGGGLYTASVNRLKWSGDPLASDVRGGAGSLALLGPFVDFYPNPKDGFHVQGAIGITGLNFAERSSTVPPPKEWSGGGGGLMFGAGYEFWVGSQWSIGGIARVLLVSATMREKDSDTDFSGKAFAPSILFVATHH